MVEPALEKMSILINKIKPFTDQRKKLIKIQNVFDY